VSSEAFCGNCGSSFPQESVRYDSSGNAYCPDCGSEEVCEAQEEADVEDK